MPTTPTPTTDTNGQLPSYGLPGDGPGCTANYAQYTHIRLPLHL